VIWGAFRLGVHQAGSALIVRAEWHVARAAGRCN